MFTSYLASVRIVLFGLFFLGCCWLWMQAVHELGHVLGAIISGGVVEKIVLHPLAISRTDVSPNPNPATVVWSGPLFGVGFPFVCLVFWYCWKLPHRAAARFYSGFCFLANGLYLSVGCWEAIGDCRQMSQTGSPVWFIFLVGAFWTVAGLLLVDGTWKELKALVFSWSDVLVVMALFTSTMFLELVLSERI